jgi:hypothetical protein
MDINEIGKHVFVISADSAGEGYHSLLSSGSDGVVVDRRHFVASARRSIIEAANAGYEFIVLSDSSYMFEIGWQQELLDHLGDYCAVVSAPFDSLESSVVAASAEFLTDGEPCVLDSRLKSAGWGMVLEERALAMGLGVFKSDFCDYITPFEHEGRDEAMRALSVHDDLRIAEQIVEESDFL